MIQPFVEQPASDAEDREFVTRVRHGSRDALEQLITRHQTFEQRSSFRTWLYRIVIDHIFNLKREVIDRPGLDFAKYCAALDRTPDADVPDPNAVPPDVQLLVDESRSASALSVILR